MIDTDSKLITVLLIIENQSHIVRIPEVLLICNAMSWIKYISESVRYKALSAYLRKDILDEVACEQAASELEAWLVDSDNKRLPNWPDIDLRLSLDCNIVDANTFKNYLNKLLSHSQKGTSIDALFDIECILSGDENTIWVLGSQKQIADFCGSDIKSNCISSDSMSTMILEYMVNSLESELVLMDET